MFGLVIYPSIPSRPPRSQRGCASLNIKTPSPSKGARLAIRHTGDRIGLARETTHRLVVVPPFRAGTKKHSLLHRPGSLPCTEGGQLSAQSVCGCDWSVEQVSMFWLAQTQHPSNSSQRRFSGGFCDMFSQSEYRIKVKADFNMIAFEFFFGAI